MSRIRTQYANLDEMLSNEIPALNRLANESGVPAGERFGIEIGWQKPETPVVVFVDQGVDGLAYRTWLGAHTTTSVAADALGQQPWTRAEERYALFPHGK